MTNSNTAITPIQLATRLNEELNPITGKNVPPQMVYNYISNNVRNIQDYITKLEVTNKDGKTVVRNFFEEEKAEEFVQVMVAAAKNRVAKKAAKEAEENK